MMTVTKLTDYSKSAGIGFGPNGLQAMDLMEEGFRPKYEKICVGNKTKEARNVFFEGLLLREGLGVYMANRFSQGMHGTNSSVGLDENWYGKSSWGHPDYTRSSVRSYPLSQSNIRM